MITKDEIRKIDAYFRASNYLSACQLYLLDNPLLRRPLKIEDIKRNIVGHWGTVPGQNFIYVHLNRIIKKYNLNMIYLSGPGHGGNAMVAQSYLEGTYSEVYPNITKDEEGLKNTAHEKIFIGKPGTFDLGKLKQSISKLMNISTNDDMGQLRNTLKHIVPTYKESTENKEVLNDISKKEIAATTVLIE